MAGVGLWIGRHVRATGDFFVAGRSLGPGAHLRDVSRRQHRRRIDRRRRRARLSRRPERVVVERVGRHRLPRARVLGRSADVAGVGDARRPDRRRFSRAALRPRPAARGRDPDLDRHAVDSGGAAARHVDGVPGRRGRRRSSPAACSARRSSACTSSPAVSSAPPTSTWCSWPSSWSDSRSWRRWRWRSPAAGTRSPPIPRAWISSPAARRNPDGGCSSSSARRSSSRRA